MQRAGRVPVFTNTAAGGGADAQQLQQQFAHRAEVRTVPAADLAEAVLAEALRGTPVVGVAGGDGSMRTAASALAHKATVLLPVPTGTLNHFARRCGVESVADAVRALDAGQVRRVAVGRFGDALFLNTLTFGEYARIVSMRERARRWLGKWPAAGAAFLVAGLSLRRFTVDLQADGRTLTRRTPLVWVGVGRGSFPRVLDSPERRRHPDLEVAVVRSGTRRAAMAFLFRLALQMWRHRHPVRDPDLDVVHAPALGLTARHRLHGTADGELIRTGRTVEIRVEPEALAVLVPADRSPALGVGVKE